MINRSNEMEIHHMNNHNYVNICSLNKTYINEKTHINKKQIDQKKINTNISLCLKIQFEPNIADIMHAIEVGASEKIDSLL